MLGPQASPPPHTLGGGPALGAGQIWQRPAVPRSVNAHLEDERLIGRIKRYVDMPGGGGYGFIDCEDTKLRFSRDVYIHKNQMNGMNIGDSVSFQVIRNAKGEPQARGVMRAEDALFLRPGAQGHAEALQGPAVHLGAPAGQAEAAAEGLMSEEQARQFQAALRGSR